jgi:hypothetical protein
MLSSIEFDLKEKKILNIVLLPEDKYEEASSTLLSKKTYLSASFIQKYDTSKGIPSDIENDTYRLYLHSLYDISYLSVLFEDSGNIAYIDEAERRIQDWLIYEEAADLNKEIYLWYDHSVSYRTMILIDFLFQTKEVNFNDKELEVKLHKLLEEQGSWLFSDSNYSLGNHGLMMDTALLELSMYMDRKEWFQKAIKRINDRVRKDFTAEGVHLENSPEYHLFVMRYYFEILDFLEYYELDCYLARETVSIVRKMPEYLTFISMPNGYLPTIGDTGFVKITSSYGNNYLEYLISRGNAGKSPPAGLYYYKEAGLAIYRETWEEGFMEDSLWWTFKSGSNNRVHKQDDDLSLVIFNRGHEIFSDAGKYNYQEDDIFRRYAVSPQSHTSISLYNESYNARKNLDKIGHLQLLDQTESYIRLRGENNAYAEVSIVRDLVFFKPSTFVIIDRISSLGEQNFSQHYLLGENMHISNYNVSGFTIESASGEFYAKVFQKNIAEEVLYFRADNSNGKGYLFKAFEEKTPTDYIEFLKKGDEFIFFTIIILEEDRGNFSLENFSFDNNTLSYSINNDIIRLDLK